MYVSPQRVILVNQGYSIRRTHPDTRLTHTDTHAATGPQRGGGAGAAPALAVQWKESTALQGSQRKRRGARLATNDGGAKACGLASNRLIEQRYPQLARRCCDRCLNVHLSP
eukprot:COSAG02_NODE_19030_length_904_cov_0.998758_1_plen_112_part_00